MNPTLISAAKILVIPFVIGPALFFYGVAYWLRKPEDWSGPAVVISIGLLLTVFSQWLGLKKIRAAEEGDGKLLLEATRIAGLVGGVVVGVVVFFVMK